MQDCLLFIALRRVTGDDDVSSPDTRHSVPHTLHHGRGLVAQDTGKETLGVVTVQGVDVRVTESIADDLRDNITCGKHCLALTLTRTSPALGGATWISVTSRGFLAFQATAALQVIVFPLVALRLSRNSSDILNYLPVKSFLE